MYTIFEQKSKTGLGHSATSFSERFETICQEHIATKRAKAFAFIFYDFCDQAYKRILKDHGVFTKLDRLSGDRLSVFYLHSDSRIQIERFNADFLKKLGIASRASLPCVVFFRLEDGEITDISCIPLNSSDPVHAFQELYSVIEAQLPPAEASKSQSQNILRSSAKFLGIESAKVILKFYIEKILK